MFCTSCGKKMDMLSKYCPGCGRKAVKAKILPGLDKLFPKAFRVVSKAYAKTSAFKKRMEPYYRKTAKFIPALAGIFMAVILTLTLIIPAYGRRMFELGREYIASMRYKEAVTAFSRASAAGISGPEISALLGEALINIGEFERAREQLLSEGEELTPLKLRLLADVWQHEGDEQMFISTLRELIRLMPNDAYAYFRLSAHYREAGLFENAASVLESLLARRRNPAAQAELYNIYMESFVLNTSTERAALIRQDAMRALNTAYAESLDVGGGRAVSLSPSGGFAAVYVREAGRRYLAVYELRESEFRRVSSFMIPVNYVIDPGMIVWSPDETMLAFFNSGAEEFVSDSSIFICDIIQNRIYSLTDPGADFARYMGPEGVFVLDTLAAFSEDSRTIYFARHTPAGSRLASACLGTGEISYLFEPPAGGRVSYNIIERGGRVFFSVAGDSPNPLWGIYVYEGGEAVRLEFDYDSRLHNLALKEVSGCGRFLLYYLTVASQNDSMFFGVVDLRTMESPAVYPQEHDIANERIVAMNKSSVFGTERRFITRNATFGFDGRSLVVAEDGGEAYGKTIRRFALKGSGVGSFVYLSFDLNGAGAFAVPQMNKSGVWFREVRSGEFLVYDEGFKLLRVGG